jgi:hypothetical protein
VAREPDAPGGMTGPQAELLRLTYGALAAQVVYVAAKLGLADLLKDGPRPAADLAAAVGVNAGILTRFLRALRQDSVQPRAIFNTEVLQPLWNELLHTLRTGESGAARVLGMSHFEYFAAHPEVGALFDRVMTSAAGSRLRPAVAAYDFGRFGTIVDVGGGNGALLIEVLRAYDGPRGIVFDLPAVAERAQQNIAAAGLADRCVAIGGSAFETVPPGGDAYVLANFLVDLDDERAAGILRRCREAMNQGGRVLLVERVMPAGGESADPYKFWDTTTIGLTMLALGGAGGGRVRTAGEFRALLEAGGLTLAEIIPTTSSLSIIEARPTQP